jgi:hypothetical protein
MTGLSPGFQPRVCHIKKRALTRRFVVVLVLVLESGHAERWSTGVWEYCAKSELHPSAAGLEVLKARKTIRLHLNRVWDLRTILPPLRGGPFLHPYPGLKPRAESFHPFGMIPLARRILFSRLTNH